MNLRLGDVFQTERGVFVVTGIRFSRGINREGILIKPYRCYKDEHYEAKFVPDSLVEENKYIYKGNKRLGDVQ